MRSQKGKILSWIIFAILLVVVFVGLIYFQKIRKEVVEKLPVEVVEEEEKPVEIKKPKMPEKLAVPELSEKEKAELDNEAINKALQSGEGCEAIKYDPELRQKCEDVLNYNEALKKTDEKLCLEIVEEELKTECLDHVYATLAAERMDAEFCKKITDDDMRQNCLDRIQASFGRTAESAQTCEGIKEGSLRQQCLDNFYYSSSIENLDEASCENIADLKLKERCQATVVKNIEVVEISKQQAIQTYQSDEEKLAGCDELSGANAQTCKDEANYDLALSQKDISYCNTIENNVKKDECIKVQSANINNFYLRQAVSRQDPSLCNKILDEGLRASCLTHVQ